MGDPMSSIVLSGDTSGSVTLDAPAISGNTVLTLPTTSGTILTTAGGATVPFALGSASTPSITFTGDTNTGIFSPAADTISFAEGGVESMRIDSSGNVGIGTSSPAARLDTQVSSGNTIARFINTVSGSGLGEVILAAPNRPAVRFNLQTSVDSNGFFNYDSGEFIWFANSGGSAVERGRFDSSGNFRFNSGFGSVATAYGCRAWVNFNGQGTVAIRGSGNVSSITDVGTGTYWVNFNVSMPDINYCVQGNRNWRGVFNPDNWETGRVYMIAADTINNTQVDPAHCFVSIYR
jgi:hypothetical protein